MILLLESANLLLRPVRDTDIEFVFQGLSHAEVIRYYGVSFISLEQTKIQMDWYATLEREKTGRWWAICDHRDEHFYGAIGFNDIHPAHHRAEIGFWLMPAYWGKGFVSEAASLIIKHAFEEISLHRLYAYVETDNTNSKKLLQKLQFVNEGTMKEYEMKNGKWIDMEIYALHNNSLME